MYVEHPRSFLHWHCAVSCLVAIDCGFDTTMSGKTGGNGTCSSPIVVDSDSEMESDAEILVQVPGSPLKVICSERYR